MEQRSLSHPTRWHRQTPPGSSRSPRRRISCGCDERSFSPTGRTTLHVGLDGWGDYSSRDGCFSSCSLLRGKVRKPVGRVHENGIRIDFAIQLIGSPYQAFVISLPSNGTTSMASDTDPNFPLIRTHWSTRHQSGP